MRIYNKLSGIKGIPIVHMLDTEGDYDIMVMELLGKNLEVIFKERDRYFSTTTVVLIAIQLVINSNMLDYSYSIITQYWIHSS